MCRVWELLQVYCVFFFFKQKTSYEIRISGWSSDVCSSDLHGIFGAIRDNAMLSKFAGGLGNDWTPVRGMGGYIKGTNGKSNGVVPFMKVANDTAVAVNQGGKIGRAHV